MSKKLTTEIFVKRGKIKHNNFYSYPRTVYINSTTHVTITCPIHGDFEQRPVNHLQGKGCPQCRYDKVRNKLKLPLEKFKKKSNKVHNGFYSYPRTIIKNTRTNVIITCPIHGDFEQTPDNHMNGAGCPSCGINSGVNKRKLHRKSNPSKKLNTNTVIEKLISIFGDIYDYSLVKYVNYRTKIKLTCLTHGVFEKNIKTAFSGCGCPRCQTNYLNTEKFIARGNKTHNGFYSYPRTVYVNARTNVIITCPIHGDFEQEPKAHYKGAGCMKCVNENKKSNTEEFVQKADETHNGFYSYPRTVYVNAKSNVIITCPVHGDFEQRATTHLSGGGCPKCQFSSGESQIRGYLEQNKIPYEYQKRYEECRNINSLPFDFFIPKYNLLIEYNGRQHYESIDFFGGDEKLEKQQKRDLIKEQYSKDNNINLLVIPYTDYDRIEEILDIYIQKLANDKKS